MSRSEPVPRWSSASYCGRSSPENELVRWPAARTNSTGVVVVDAVGAEVLCPGYHRKKCRFERPLAERRKTGTDPVKPLDTFSVPAASISRVVSGGQEGRLADVQHSGRAVFLPCVVRDSRSRMWQALPERRHREGMVGGHLQPSRPAAHLRGSQARRTDHPRAASATPGDSTHSASARASRDGRHRVTRVRAPSTTLQFLPIHHRTAAILLGSLAPCRAQALAVRGAHTKFR